MGNTNNGASRAYLALTRVFVPERSLDLGYKLITALNLMVKFAYSWAGEKPDINLRWRLNDCLATVRFPDIQYRFHLRKNSDYNVYMNPYFHEYDITTFIHSVLKPGDVFVDAGAHAGSYTLQAANITGRGGKVISIEPNPENLTYLKLNVLLNRLENVVVIPKAVGEANGKVTLFYDPSKTALTSIDRAFLGGQRRPKSFETSLTTLDDIYLERVSPREIKVIKIDTEGNDLRVLSGARRTLSKTHHVIAEQNTNDARRFLSDEGFEIHDMRPSGYLLATKSVVAA